MPNKEEIKWISGYDWAQECVPDYDTEWLSGYDWRDECVPGWWIYYDGRA